MQVELPIFLGARIARWRRSYPSLSVSEFLVKLRRRFTGPVFRLYRKCLGIEFSVRNLLTRGAEIKSIAGGVTFSLAPEGSTAFDFWSGLRFEWNELEFLLKMIWPGTTFVDIGANAGLFTLAAATKLRGSDSAIYAFEPCSGTFDILERNIRLNRLKDIHAFRLALSDRPGVASLWVNARLKDGLNSLKDPSHPDAQVVGRVEVQTASLDEFIQEKGITRVDVMKVDVEGAELLVFRGARKLLSREDAPLILYEGYSWCTAGFHYHPVEIMWLLEECGYELFVLDSASGRVRRRKPGENYDAMMVAVKPAHSRYANVLAEGQAA